MPLPSKAIPYQIDVLVVEQMSKCSGSLSVCAGNIDFAGSDYQKAQGVNDVPDEYYKDGLNSCHGEPAMWRAFVDNHLDTYRLITGLGYKPMALWILPAPGITRREPITSKAVGRS